MTVGVLLSNLGTPDAPTPQAVRNYLREFLSDPHVVKIPRIIWAIILYGFILPFRSRRSAQLYQKIWTTQGSPLKVISNQQVDTLQKILGDEFKVILGMRYAHPSLKSALDEFKKLKINKIIVLPLYPQYSFSTTGSTLEAVKKYSPSAKMSVVPEYYDHPEYISAIANTLRNIHTQKILFSFHGLPQKFVDDGDPYFDQCHKTVTKVAETLKLPPDKYAISFQSRLGKAQWLKPYTDHILKQWAGEGVKSVSVICPGFAADCLETLEEINMQNRKLFLDAGGEVFNYISALNASVEHIGFLSSLIKKQARQWL